MIAVLTLLLISFGSRDSREMSPSDTGVNVGDFRLTDAGGSTRSISSYNGNVMVIVFWSFRCPVALAYESRLRALVEKHGNGGVVFVGVDPNPNESPEEIRLNSANLNLPFPVLLDDQGALADRLEITHIPAVVVLDRESVVRYWGAVDNNKQPGDRSRIPYLEEALDDVLTGQPVGTPQTKLFGCNMKRKAP